MKVTKEEIIGGIIAIVVILFITPAISFLTLFSLFEPYEESVEEITIHLCTKYDIGCIIGETIIILWGLLVWGVIELKNYLKKLTIPKRLISCIGNIKSR